MDQAECKGIGECGPGGCGCSLTFIQCFWIVVVKTQDILTALTDFDSYSVGGCRGGVVGGSSRENSINSILVHMG